MKCQNVCDKEATRTIPITLYGVCEDCYEHEAYLHPVEATRIVAMINLYDYGIYRYITSQDEAYSYTKHILASHSSAENHSNYREEIDFEDVDWTLFDNICLLPNVQRVKTKLIDKGFAFNIRYSPHKQEGKEWEVDVLHGNRMASLAGPDEEYTLFKAIYVFFTAR